MLSRLFTMTLKCVAGFLMLGWLAASSQAQSIEVLWYKYETLGGLYTSAIQTLANEAHTYPEGSGVVWNLTFFGPGDTPDFTAYDVLVTQSWDFWPNDYSGILENRSALESARGTRTFITTQDADWHYLVWPGPDNWDGPRGFLVNAVNWAASGSGLGIVALDDIGLWWIHEDSFLKDELTGFYKPNEHTDMIIIPPETADFPVNAGLTSAGLSNWGSSAHGRIDKNLPGYMSINDFGPDPAWAVTVVTEQEADGDTTPSPSAVQLACTQAFLPPFQNALTLKRNNRRAIPVKMVLVDDQGLEITDLDIEFPPVVQVSASGASGLEIGGYDESLLPPGLADDGNQFRYDWNAGHWIINLATKQYTAQAEYLVEAISVDESYEISGCSQFFIRE